MNNDVNSRESNCHRKVLRTRHLLYVVTSDLSTVSNALRPLVTCCECCDSAIRLETVWVEGDTLLETLDDSARLFSDECLREEVNGGDECSELHGVCSFDSLNIHGYGVLCAFCRQFANWSYVAASSTLFCIAWILVVPRLHPIIISIKNRI